MWEILKFPLATKPAPAEGKEMGVQGHEQGTTYVSNTHSSMTLKVQHLKVEVADG